MPQKNELAISSSNYCGRKKLPTADQQRYIHPYLVPCPARWPHYRQTWRIRLRQRLVCLCRQRIRIGRIARQAETSSRASHESALAHRLSACRCPRSGSLVFRQRDSLRARLGRCPALCPVWRYLSHVLVHPIAAVKRIYFVLLRNRSWSFSDLAGVAIERWSTDQSGGGSA